MRKLVPLVLLAAMFAVAASQYTLQLVPEAVITIEAMSEQEIEDLGWTGHTSSGLSIVGKESIVYLSVAEAAGEDITDATWTLTGPVGFTAALATIDGYPTWRTFHPDMTGTYTVNVDITTASGTGSASTTIKSAEYVAVGGQAGAGASILGGQCAACHVGTYSTWLGTNHSSAFTRKIDGHDVSFYAQRCDQCHTVGYDVTANNGGFDDVMTAVGFPYPTEFVDGNWQNIVDNFAPLAQFANIQCENCHGPGSMHRGDVTGIEVSVEEGVCGQCHDAQPYHTKSTMWKNSSHATGSSFSRGTRAGCADCHSTYGFIARIDVASDLDQKVGTGEGITCAACHDPHQSGDGHPHQIRTVEDVELADGTVVTWGGHGKVCMQCHRANRSGLEQADAGSSRQDPHRNPQTDMLAGNNTANTFGRYIPSSTHRDALEDVCADCHMHETPADGEPGRFLIGEHTWAMVAEDNGVVVENTSACARCHGEFDSFDDFMARTDHDGDEVVEDVRSEVRGLMESLALLLPPVGEPTVDRATGSETKTQQKAIFNYNFVNYDGSNGIHNFQYAVGLLKVTIGAMQYGILNPSEITSIDDVPNDQGKQVMVSWNRFGGDGISDDPIATYYVWRSVESAGKAGATFDLLEDVPVDGAEGPITIIQDGHLWTAVASQPASQMDMYSAVAPTIFDEADTKFMVSAHTRAGVVAQTEASMGTSIDNLVPTAPTSFMAVSQAAHVALTWDDAVDSDFDYFALYRSTRSEFDPTVMEPYATTTGTDYTDNSVVRGVAYYYQLAAFDFSGNQGDLSEKVTIAVGVGTEVDGLPVDFALNQNYPNPFNPTTTISFDVPETSDVSVIIYDLLGRPVETLASGTKAPGKHTVQVDAQSWSSGLYIVRMTTGNRVFERSILLVK